MVDYDETMNKEELDMDRGAATARIQMKDISAAESSRSIKVTNSRASRMNKFKSDLASG